MLSVKYREYIPIELFQASDHILYSWNQWKCVFNKKKNESSITISSTGTQLYHTSIDYVSEVQD